MVTMEISNRKAMAIEGMALYIEECMQEIRNQMKKPEDVAMDIIQKRVTRATGTLEVMYNLVEDLLK